MTEVTLVSKPSTMRTAASATTWGAAKPIVLWLAVDDKGREVAFDVSEAALRAKLNRLGLVEKR